MYAQISKLAVAPGLLWLAQALGLVRYASWGQVIGVGLVLALVSILTDAAILPSAGNLNAALLDAGLAALVVWLSGWLVLSAATPFFGALLTGLGFAAAEWFFMHPMILIARRAREER